VRNLRSDPFGEWHNARLRRSLWVLGARLRVTSNSRHLMRLFDDAFGGLPPHRTGATPARQRLHLHLQLDGPARRRRRQPHMPPRLRLRSGGGMLMGAYDDDNFALINPAGGSALVCASPELLASPYHLRYELIEFAVMTLVPRVQGLLPLHAASVVWNNRGVLICGDSGAGKSTLSIACLEQGLALLAEDGIFVHAKSLRATGCGNYLHLGAESLRFVRDPRLRAQFRAAPLIRRRSGARKRELDARASGLKLARSAPRLAALVLLSRRKSGSQELLRPLSMKAARASLRRLQPYAAGQRGWAEFCSRVARLPAYRLMRGPTPEHGAVAVRSLLEDSGR
jgi:hypothetical protein